MVLAQDVATALIVATAQDVATRYSDLVIGTKEAGQPTLAPFWNHQKDQFQSPFCLNQ